MEDSIFKAVKQKFATANAEPPDHVVTEFLGYCERHGFAPLENWVYLLPYKGRFQVVPSINTFRAIAQKTGNYGGVTETFWLTDDGVWIDYWVNTKVAPIAAKKGVYVRGFSQPSWGVANWAEHAKTSPQWQNMPAHMLAKIAERIAIQTAFPLDVGAYHIPEELEEVRQEAPVKKTIPPTDEQVSYILGLIENAPSTLWNDSIKQTLMARVADAKSFEDMKKKIKRTEEQIVNHVHPVADDLPR